MEKKYSRKLLVIGVLFLFLGASATLGVSERAWSDNFDSYTDGQILDGTEDDGGWRGWDNSPLAYGTVTSEQSHSSPHSVRIEVDSDLIHEFDGYTSGQWVFTAWQYVPTDFDGETYFILLSDYLDGAGQENKWAIQLRFDSALNIVQSEHGGPELPLIKGEWVELRVEIDLTADWFTFYYDGEILVAKEWTAGPNDLFDGYLDIAAVDLFANFASPVYYDDLSLEQPGNELVCDAGGPYSKIVGEPVQFNGFASGGTPPYVYAWDFGDGNTSTEEDPQHAYTEVGVYTATLTVTDIAENQATDNATVTITEEPQPEPVLEIGEITGGFGVKASVKNTGDAAATNVDWTIALDGKLVFIGKTSEGTETSIAAGEKADIKSKFILGIGKTNITVSATCDEGVSAQATKTAFVLGPFVLKVE